VVAFEEQIRSRPYAHEAYEFVHAAANRAMGDSALARGKRSITARDLCVAACDLANFQYGNDAVTRLLKWGIKDSMDLGEIIAALVALHFYLWSENEETLLEFKGIYTVGDDAWEAIRTRPQENRGRCKECGYDLRGSPSMVCPECGRVH
jgi:uncharacterized repeat protein (TIGR04138 family)